ncbi:unnamed protein product, partial [Mesorhabditis belari]|uniref:Carboxylic ester hydrolase n=1 Tax=Mesorhabditis belari TaxID=2138241 RepID=A0AAF3J7R0_9BILA
MVLRISLLIFLNLGKILADADGSPISVKTPRGTLNGFRADYGNDQSQLYYGQGDVFLGIPFVEPPLGDKRFQKPTPMCAYPQDPWNATYYRDVCPQLAGGSCALSEQSEDCLYLNVFSPNVKSVFKYPVMVWIHGGGFKNGCAQQFGYKGAIRNLVSRGVVVVTVQYRIGAIGFFTTFTDDFPPNRGLLDQLEAIRWVSDNIQYFGGNPYKVTLFGESAGGVSVSAHTYSPLTQGLFQQAIMESGVVLTSFEGALGFSNLSQLRADKLCNFTDDRWQANDWTGLKECMLGKKPEDFTVLEGTNLLGWHICQDDYFFPGIPKDLAWSRPNIPTIIGSMRDEFAFYLLEIAKLIPLKFFDREFFENLFGDQAAFLGDRQNDVMGVLEKIYAPPGLTETDNAAWFKMSSDIFTAAGFTGFIVRELDNWLVNGNKEVYLFEQTYASKIGRDWNDTTVDQLTYKPVPHTAELGFIWVQETLWKPAIAANMVTAFDYKLADWYGEKWTNFARFAKPTLTDEWKPVQQRGVNNYYILDDPTMGGLKMADSVYRYTDDIAWTRVVPALAGDYPPDKPDYNNGTNPLPSRGPMMRIERYSPYFERLQTPRKSP